MRDISENEHISSSKTLQEVRLAKQLEYAKTKDEKTKQYELANIEATMLALASKALASKTGVDVSDQIAAKKKLLDFLVKSKTNPAAQKRIRDDIKSLEMSVIDVSTVENYWKIKHYTKRLKQIKGKLEALAKAEAQGKLRGKGIADLKLLNEEALVVEKILSDLEKVEKEPENKKEESK